MTTLRSKLLPFLNAPCAARAAGIPARRITVSQQLRTFATSSPLRNAVNTPEKAEVDHRELAWDEFLKYRSYRRVFQIVCAGVTGMLGLIVGWGYVNAIEIDPTQPILGVDPMIFLGGILFLFAGFCALLGPSLANIVFKYVFLRSKKEPFRVKEDLFLEHIKSNRVDPSYQSFANPVPDYYGEKITSLHGYRRWLRNCAAYRKKRDEFLKL
ncbi:mitochondrial import protein Pam17-domain-containing protein [Limtongia smithiae]|uniref:mitochondrial import protein Pam17-domain-containing protein n=1 Tax=Limtongia smithiae TaxID=1125753 RepID=UPI0034CF8617